MLPLPHLLLVDDDEDILSLLTGFFRKHGYTVSVAENGEGLFGAVQNNAIDLVVLDVMLKQEDGFSLCRRLRATSTVPIIMLTAMADHTDRVVGLEVGADDYLVKPFDQRELLARVKAVLRRTTCSCPRSGAGEASGTGRSCRRVDCVRAGTRQTSTRNSAQLQMPAAGSSAIAQEDRQMARKTALTVVSWIVGTLATIAAALGVVLIVPGTPSKAKSLHFEGYVPLPGGSLLSVLDYLTISGSSLFVTSESTGQVYEVALRERTVPSAADVSVFSGEPEAHGVVIDPTSQMAYVTRSGVDAVDVFNPNSLKFHMRIPVAAGPDALAYDSRNKLFYAAGGDSGVGIVIDPQKLATVANIALGGKPEFAVFDPGSGLLYQNLEDTDSVVTLDLARKAVVDRWKVAPCRAPTAMALDEVQRRLFIGCKDNAMLAVLDADTHRVTATVPIGKGVDSVAFDAGLHRIYTTGKSGQLVVIQQDAADSYRVLDSISLHYGAHTLTVDPSTHRVYVAYASLLVQPRLAVFSVSGGPAP
jgi:DNA-binding response OmpR family regulator/DNA-binding beta-propeller fold protein YncE